MAPTRVPARFERLLALADVRIDGQRPWDIQVHHPGFVRRVLGEGSLGLGESYMDRWWDCPRLDELFFRILRAGLDARVKSWALVFDAIKARLFNLQRVSRAFRIGQHHYDIGNDLFRAMLDSRMIYSCAYWDSATSLDEAQEAKLDLIGHKLQLSPGMRVLDIGCGWGGTAQFLAERYQANVVGITVSQEQVKAAKERCRGLPVEIRLQDYRTLNERFDRILSVGMFEHVGYKNYRVFLEIARKLLNDDGLLLLHTIGRNQSSTASDPWISRYIFPNSMLPSAKQITTAAEGVLVIEDWQNLGIHYDRTLREWYANFEQSWPQFQGRYGERFYRMWKYYLLSCAGAFRARAIQVWQIVLSPRGVLGGYSPVRRITLRPDTDRYFVEHEKHTARGW